MGLSCEVLELLQKDLQEIQARVFKMVENTEWLHKSLSDIKLPIKKLIMVKKWESWTQPHAEACLENVNFLINEIRADESLQNQQMLLGGHFQF